MSRLRREGEDLIGDLFVEPDLRHLQAIERGIGEERLEAQEHASLGVHRQVLVRVSPTALRVILLPAACLLFSSCMYWEVAHQPQSQ